MKEKIRIDKFEIIKKTRKPPVRPTKIHKTSRGKRKTSRRSEKQRLLREIEEDFREI